MAVVVTALGSKATTVNGASITSDVLLAAAPVGSLVVGYVTCPDSLSVFTFTDTKTNTWQLSTTKVSTGSGNSQLAWTVVTNALTTSDTVNVTSGRSSVYTLALTRYDTPLAGSTSVNVADVQITGSGSGTSMTSGQTAGTTNAHDLVIGAFSSDAVTSTFTKGASYTAADPNTPPSNAFWITWGEYLEVFSPNPQTADGTQTFSGGWHAHCITFKLDSLSVASIAWLRA